MSCDFNPEATIQVYETYVAQEMAAMKLKMEALEDKNADELEILKNSLSKNYITKKAVLKTLVILIPIFIFMGHIGLRVEERICGAFEKRDKIISTEIQNLRKEFRNEMDERDKTIKHLVNQIDWLIESQSDKK